MVKTMRLVVRVEPEVKSEAESVYEQLGLTLSQAVNIFLRQSVEQGGLPFELKLNKPVEPK
ncbi:MAG: type II toxin-antitoxin system RelB/DinJ family antitoxin [Acidaminococcaceae bacterium]